jgi:hypothetical protein
MNRQGTILPLSINLRRDNHSVADVENILKK